MKTAAKFPIQFHPHTHPVLGNQFFVLTLYQVINQIPILLDVIKEDGIHKRGYGRMVIAEHMGDTGYFTMSFSTYIQYLASTNPLFRTEELNVLFL